MEAFSVVRIAEVLSSCNGRYEVGYGMHAQLIVDADTAQVYCIEDNEKGSGWSGEGIGLKKYYDSLQK